MFNSYFENIPLPSVVGAARPSPPCPHESVPRCGTPAHPSGHWRPSRVTPAPPGSSQTAFSPHRWTVRVTEHLPEEIGGASN